MLPRTSGLRRATAVAFTKAMAQIHRRVFPTAAGAGATAAIHFHLLFAATVGPAGVDETFHSRNAHRRIPAAGWMVGSVNRTPYTSAFGTRDSFHFPPRRYCCWCRCDTLRILRRSQSTRVGQNTRRKLQT
jgi:hypothetical protein